MPVIETTTWFLEMRAAPGENVAPPFENVAVARVQNPSVPYYRELYEGVGRDYHWRGRKLLSDEELGSILAGAHCEIHVLRVEGVDAGFAELDTRDPAKIELVQFGLLSRYLGKGLGKYFLNHILHIAWAHRPLCVWLHTCSLDHPAALPNYLGMGFKIVREVKAMRSIEAN